MKFYSKNEYETAMAKSSDEDFERILRKFENERNIHFRRDLPRAILEQCIWCVYSENYDRWSDSWVSTPDRDKDTLSNFSAESIRTNPYKYTTSKYWVYGLIYTQFPITRQEVRKVLLDTYLFERNGWNIDTSIDNAVYEMRQDGILDSDADKNYIII